MAGRKAVLPDYTLAGSTFTLYSSTNLVDAERINVIDGVEVMKRQLLFEPNQTRTGPAVLPLKYLRLTLFSMFISLCSQCNTNQTMS